MGKLRTALIFGAGYVVGTKAGRERYETIRQRARTIAEHPRTQQLVQQAKDTAATRLPASVTERLPGRSATGWHGTAGADETIDLTTPPRTSTTAVVAEPTPSTAVPPSHL